MTNINNQEHQDQMYTLIYIRTRKYGPEAQLFLILTLIVTFLNGGQVVFMLNMITNDPSTIRRTHFLNASIS